MNTITIIPYSGNPAAPYPAANAVTNTFAGWGIADGFTRRSSGDGGRQPETVHLSFPGTSGAADIFPYRALVKIVRDGLPFFTGAVPEDSEHLKSGHSDRQMITVVDPSWWLEHMLFEQQMQIVTAVDINGNPTYETLALRHFTLNLPTAVNITNTAPVYSVTYTPNLLDSAAQIAAVLDFAKGAGAYLDYNLADLMAVPVEPVDVLNITCADAIRRQLDMYDCVVWWDHTQDPPRLHVQRRSQLTAVTRTKGPGGTIRDFQLHKRTDMKVPFVQVDLEEPYDLGNGVSGTSIQSIIYPPPAGSVQFTTGGYTYWQPPNPLPPASDMLHALITTVPLKGFQQHTVSKFIQTDVVAPSDATPFATAAGQPLNWWQRRRRDMDPNFNANFATDYNGVALVAGSATRQLNAALYPNMIIGGGWAPWMGGTFGYDHALAQVSYHRKTTAALSGSKVTAHTLHANCHCTNLNFPNGAWLRYLVTTSGGGFFNQLTQIPQLIYEDLAVDQWEGQATLVETAWTGDLTLGHVLNVLGDRADYATMNALVQSVEMTVKTGSITTTLTLGPNKAISAQQWKARLQAARWRYVTALWLPGSGTDSQLTQEEKTDATSQAHPAKSEDNLISYPVGADPSTSPAGNVQISGNAGNPIVTLQSLNPDGTLNPAVPQIILSVADLPLS